MKPKYKHLLKDPDVKRWYSNNARGSIITAEERLRRLGRLCATINRTPKSLVQSKRKDPEGFDEFVMDFVDASLSKGEHPAQVRNNILVVKSWLGHFGLRIDRTIKLPPIDYGQERVPTKEELSQVLRHCDLRTRVTASLIAFSGLRLESIGNYLGNEGLRLKDLPEVRVSGDEAILEKIPTQIVVRPPLSKARHQYFTFLNAEGCQYLKEYLESRLRSGEKLTPDSPLIRNVFRRKNEFIRTMKVSFNIKQAILKAGFDWRPYVLRSYCATAFDVAEARGLISHPWRQFFMGHKGDIEARYSTNKRLSPDMIEEMRAAYQKCEPLLSTIVPQVDQLSLVKEAKIEALKSLAKSLLDVDLLDVKIAKEKENGHELSQDETIELFETEMKRLREQPDPQIIVGEKELQSYLHEGWQFVAVLPSGNIVVRK